MRRGFCRPTPRHARHATSIASNSGWASRTGKTRRIGFNTPLAQRELRARGRNWSEGRIAECPRLQQNGSSDELSFSCIEGRIINVLIDPHRPSRRSSFIVPDVTPEERSENYFPVSHSVARPATAATRLLRTLASYR